MNQTLHLFAILAVLLAPAIVSAQDQPDYVPDKIETTAEGKKVGWHPMLKASGTAAFAHAQGVVGTDDGSTWNFGLLLDSGLNWRHARGHVWENILKWQLTYSRTPLIDQFFKSMDNFEFSSTYMYELPAVPWLGPFASVKLVTSLLPGNAIRPADASITRQAVDGTVLSDDETLKANQQLRLTNAFAPATLRESVGIFAHPITKKVFDFQARLGIGAWEVFTQDGWAVASEDAGVITLKQMQDSVQIGGELELKAKGALATAVNWGARAGFMQPFHHNADTELTGAELMNMEFEASLGVKITTWASLDYALKAFKYPLIVDDWQITNSLLLTATANIL